MGQDSAGQIGDGTATAGGQVQPVAKSRLLFGEQYNDKRKYTGGAYHVFADTSDGYYCWGGGTHGVFGNGSTGDITSGPAKWTNVSNIKKFMASTQHTDRNYRGR